jgi:hypothetical protein
VNIEYAHPESSTQSFLTAHCCEWLTQFADGKGRWEPFDFADFIKGLPPAVPQQPQLASAAAAGSAAEAQLASKVVPDLAFKLMQSASSSSSSASTKPGRYGSALEIKRYSTVFRQGEPINFVELINRRDPQKSAKAIIDQAYTYLVLLQAEFALLSAWFGTWLLWRPIDQPCIIRVSHCYQHDAQHPAATPMGAMGWLQEQVLKYTASGQRVHAAYEGPVPSPGSRGAQAGGRGGQGGGAAGPSGGPHTRGSGRGRSASKR